MKQASGRGRPRGDEDHPGVATGHATTHDIATKHKFIAWTKILEETLAQGTTTAKELESIIRQLGHLGMAIPTVYHFLSQLRDLQFQATRKRKITVTEECRRDLELMINVIDKEHSGISMNSVIYQRPTHIYRSDSCPAGLGGYSDKGFTWQYYLPPELKFRATNNLLEHLAAVITPWIDILAGRLGDGASALSMTDSTTSEGWLRKSNFSKINDDATQATVRLKVARKHASQYMTLGIKDYSQWFLGVENTVADALSRDDDKSDDKVTRILRSCCPSQIPDHFEIQPLPNKITSWLTVLLLKLPVREQLFEKHTRTEIGRGNDGQPTATGLALKTISLTTSQDMPESNSSEHLQWPCGRQDFQDNLMTHWLTAQSEVPFHMYARPFARTGDQTPPWMTMERLDSFYNRSYAHSRKETQTKSIKKRSLCPSYPHLPKHKLQRRTEPSSN
jgi:hypothetical protein